MWIMSIISFFIALPYANYFFAGSKVLSFLGAVNVLTIIGVPLLSLIMFISKHVFKTRTSPNFKAGIWAFFTINVISFFAVGSYQGSQFSSHAERLEEIDLSAITSDTIFLNVDSDPYRSAAFRFGHLKISDKKLISRHVHFNVEKAEGEQFELVQEIYARGKTEQEALRLAGSIAYTLKIEDNVITMPRIIEFPKGEKWRNQQVELTLKVPDGKYIHLQERMRNIANHFEINRDQDYPRFEDNQTWLMESKGLINPNFIRKSQRSDEFQFKDFENLQIDGDLNVTVEKGTAFKIAMSGRPHYLDKVEIVQLQKTLNINFNNDYHSSPVRITITLPELKSIDTKNTGDVKIQGFTQKAMKVKHDGKSVLNVLANIDSLSVRQAGRGKVILRGEGQYLESVLGKSSKLEADRYQVKNADIKAGISSRASIAVSDSLWTFKDAGARISNDGSPKIFEKNVTDHE